MTHFFVHEMDDLGDRLHVIEGDAPAGMDSAIEIVIARALDQIDAVLDFLAHLGDELIARVAQHRERGNRRCNVARHIGADAVPVGDVVSARRDARPLDQPGIDRIAERDVDVPLPARRADAGDTGAEHLLQVMCAFEGAVFDA